MTEALGLLTDDPEVVDPTMLDIVVELIGGIEPARTLSAALRAGQPVVTGDKEFLATAGTELADLASARGGPALRGGGRRRDPPDPTLRESLAGERVLAVMGIVNGTTNFILSRMAQGGLDYDDALAEAQSLG